MAEVFISYAREDQGFVRDIHSALQKVNRDTWIDWRSIPDSAKWRAEIFAAIEAADNFLFVVSPDSAKSWMCRKEVSHAVANNKRLITILYHSVEPKELPPTLREIQWIDYPELGFEQTFERLTAAIDTDLNWVRKHTQFLVRATEWESKDRDQGFLLHGMELKESVHWLEQAATSKGRKPTELQEQYIRASEEWEAGEIQRLTDLTEEKERQRQEAERQRQEMERLHREIEEAQRAIFEGSKAKRGILGRPRRASYWPEVLVLMPFTATMKPVYQNHIKKVVSELGLRIGRTDDPFGTGPIMRDIWSAIHAARIVVADCIGRSPNVFYEIGLAHAIGKDTILISQSRDDIPFDLQHLRMILYKYTPPGMREFEETLIETITRSWELSSPQARSRTDRAP